MKYIPRPVLRQAVALGGRGVCGVSGGWAPPVLTGTCFRSGTTRASGGVTGGHAWTVSPSLREALTAGGTGGVGTFMLCHRASGETGVLKPFCRVPSAVLSLSSPPAFPSSSVTF